MTDSENHTRQPQERIDRIVFSIREKWGDAAPSRSLSRTNREHLRGLRILNSATFYCD